MTRSRNKLAIQSLSIGFSAAVLALACGADDTNNETGPVVIPREDPCLNPLNVECQTKPADVAPGQQTTTPPVTPPDDKKPTDQTDLEKAAVENVLNSNCGYCHGPKLTQEQAKAGMNFINDIDALVKAGKITPMNSAESRIIQRMKKGEMPPLGSGYPNVSTSDIEKVAAYIDNPRYWPGVPDTNCKDKNQLLSFDDIYQDINEDLQEIDNEDQPFMRYISLGNRFTAGVCSDALDKDDRQGLVKMMNMLSVKAKIGDVTPADKTGTLYRIDLRDFDWDRQVTIAGEQFNDVWEAILDKNPYAIELFGDDADDAKDDTLTTVPLMMADQMMDVAVIGNLYYGILDIDIAQPLANFISVDLGINVQEDIDDGEAIRAGTTRSIVSRQDRLVERHDINVRGGAFWQSFDFDANAANDSIFEDPFGFTAGGSEAIFTLPNGMLAYIIADENDAIVEDSDILFDSRQGDFKAITAVSCSNCHGSGLISLVDEVGPVARANARQIGLNNDQRELLDELYVSKDKFAAQIKEDTEGFYQLALQRASLPIQGGDPVSRVFLRFDDDLDLSAAAGDLGVLPSDLQRSLNLLNPRLAILGDATLDRDDFTALYLESLCELTVSNDNAPDEAVCAQFL